MLVTLASRCVGRRAREWAGIVDFVAIRKNLKGERRIWNPHSGRLGTKIDGAERKMAEGEGTEKDDGEYDERAPSRVVCFVGVFSHLLYHIESCSFLLYVHQFWTD